MGGPYTLFDLLFDLDGRSSFTLCEKELAYVSGSFNMNYVCTIVMTGKGE